ncbi:FecR domain-containing protein [Candidatus Dependentiae bacterium]|nr:FecR domain-containing protein [Candidatus Dependentiae bacterium]
MIKKILSVIFILSVFFLISVQAAGISGKIIKTNGVPLINGKKTTLNSTVNEGDLIETEFSEKSYADILFSNGTYIRLKENSKLKLIKTSNKFKLNLKSGKIFVNVEKLHKNQSFVVFTPVSVVGVRGTKFALETTDRQSYICVCEGIVAVNKKNIFNRMFSKDVEVSPDYDLWIKSGYTLKKPAYSPDMLKATVSEFENMGFKINK